MKVLHIIRDSGSLAYRVCKDEQELSVPYVKKAEYDQLKQLSEADNVALNRAWAERDRLRQVNSLVLAVVGEMECRGDEDCDHCELTARLREAIGGKKTGTTVEKESK